MLWTDVWWCESTSAKAARIALTPLSWVYAAGWTAYASLYKVGLKRPTEAHRPVICVGNLVVGGSGKSPLTMSLARTLRELRFSVVVGCSGYGSPSAEAARVAPDGPLEAGRWGDEASMIRWLMPDLPLIVGRRRVLAARLCNDRFPDSVLIMDDGFQHLPLREHVTLLLDEENPSNSRCLPAGPYREPRSNRSRADTVIPGRFRVESRIVEFRDTDGHIFPESGIRSAAAVCALGQPERFLTSLREIGIELVGQVVRPDHDSLVAGNLLDAIPVGVTVVTTAKDWVKMRSRNDIHSRTVLIAIQDTRVEPEAEFRQWIAQSLNEIASQTARS